mgnify:CR=1 FL=1
MRKAVVLHSGGLDSTTALYWAVEWAHGADNVVALSVLYGQRHEREVRSASHICHGLGVEHKIVDLRTFGTCLPGALTGGDEVPHGHYAEENMKVTVVPNRNVIFLSLAYALAVSIGDDSGDPVGVVISVHGGDHYVYPDCRPDFLHAFEAMEWKALEGRGIPRLIAPFSKKDKIDIACYARSFAVPIEETWSCYEGKSKHCGRCGTCVERIWALHQAGVQDPTEYADTEYWKEVMADELR